MEHILIIDDDESIRSIFIQLLEGNGYSVEAATEGKEGLKKIDARKPDLIITDIMMPEMDGLEMVTYIRQNHPNLPVIAISGGMQAAPVNFLPMAKQFGACKVFEKPVPLGTLLEAVKELLSEKADS